MVNTSRPVSDLAGLSRLDLVDAIPELRRPDYPVGGALVRTRMAARRVATVR